MEFSTTYIIAQIFGLLATVSMIASVQFKNKAHILILMIANAIIFTISFILLEAYSGAAVCVLGIFISSTIFFVERAGHRVRWPLIVIFALAEVIAIILTFQTPWDILPGIGTGFWLASLLQSDENRLRWLMIINGITWVAYDIAIMAYTTMLGDIFLIISSAIALARYRKVDNSGTS